MSKLAGHARAALMGVLFAMVGFSYALATYEAPALTPRAPGAAGRGVGSNLHFTNPLVSDGSGDFDLGDAVAGSVFNSRFVTAAGGVPKYTFSSTNLKTVASSLVLQSSGLITGSIANNAVSPLRFGVTVTDSFGTSGNKVTGTMRVTLVDNLTFAFGIDALQSGSVGRSYTARLITVNGVQPLKLFTVTGVSGTGNLASAKALSDAGLALNQLEGTIYGKPSASGTLTFTANATDKKGSSALSRNRSATGQVFTITISNDNAISSDVVFTAIKISGDTATGGKDKINVSALVNLGSSAVSSFSGQTIVFKLDSYASPVGTFDSKGGFVSSSSTQGFLSSSKGAKGGGGAKNTKSPVLKGKLGSNGQLKFQISNESFGSLNQVTGLSASGSSAHGVQLIMGTSTDAADTLVFSNKTSKTKFNASYKLGVDKSGTVSDQGGNFMITGVTGKDAKGSAADTFKVAFVATPTKGSSFNGASSATVAVGNFTDSPNLSVTVKSNNVKSGGKVDPKSEHITKLSMSANGKGSLQTGILTKAHTLIPTASGSTSTNFAAGVSLLNGSNTVFGGVSAATIFAKSTSWSGKNPSK